MTRIRMLIGVVACLLPCASAAAQGGGRGEAPGITRGAGQPNQNRWNAKSPWGKTERSAPIEAQRKEPFKLFDNVYYVGSASPRRIGARSSASSPHPDSGIFRCPCSAISC